MIAILLIIIFRWAPLPSSSFMLQQTVASWFNKDVPAVRHHWVSMERIPPEVALAVVSSEDQLFPEHWGIDREATKTAILASLNGKSAKGGSTITQQVAKNMFLWSGRSYVRKGLEWGLAIFIDALWSKRRILEVYLNIAQFSAADYGVGAAAANLLKKPVDKITTENAAALAAVLPSPATYSVTKPTRYILKRRKAIQKQMRQLGGIDYLADL